MKSKIFILLLLIGTSLLFMLYSLDNIIIPSHEPGIYGDDIELSFNAISGIDIYYNFVESIDKKAIKYIFPLSLTAMTGENRNYCLVVTAMDEDEIVETILIEYNIDKDIPNSPTLNYKDGLYNKSLSLEFIDSGVDIYYSSQSSGENNFKLWRGEIIKIKQDKSLTTEFIKSYCEDSAGNRSSAQVNSFTILPITKEHISLEVLSPVEGVF